MAEKTFAFIIILFIIFPVSFIHAQDSAQNSAQDSDKIFESSRKLVLQTSTLPEAKLGFTQSYRFPFLQGDNFLTEDNNIKFDLTAEISPVSLNGIAEAIWTPAAFFEFITGGRIGTGWNIELFGGDIIGIGINRAGTGKLAELNGSGFDGLLWKAQAGGALQFDFAAIKPGDWNHVLFRTYHEINYKGYTKAKSGESWYFENDDGENVNGLNYYANYLIGYQMPIVLNMVALLAESDLYLYDTPNRSVWGDDRMRWTFSGIFNFGINEQIEVAALAQFRTRRNYIESNWEDLYYRERTLDTSNPVRLEFYRVAVILSYKF